MSIAQRTILNLLHDVKIDAVLKQSNVFHFSTRVSHYVLGEMKTKL